MSAAAALAGSELAARLVDIVGPAHVLTERANRRFYSQDIFRQGPVCAAVVRPATAQEVSKAVRVAAAMRHAVIARGGGMSYTGGYLPVSEATVVVDLARMNAVVEIAEDDMFATVEAGCTWAALANALAPTGLTTPYWGPLSGLRSTVGGAMSQNSVFFGSGLHGTAADSALGVTVVLADGDIVTTGSGGGANANAFFRHYGPDLTGLFTGDAGAFGIKTHVTLRLVRRKVGRGHASFAFADRAALVAAMQGIGRAGVATECFAFDPYLQSVRMARAGLMSDLKTLGAVVAKQGAIAGARLALAGRRFAADVAWPLHVASEGHDQRTAEAALESARRIVRGCGGRETENSVPKAVDAAPFGPMNGMLGNDGERWVPVHGVLPHSRVPAFLETLDKFFATRRPQMEELGIRSGYLLTTVQAGAMLIEPVFYWRDARMEIHDRSVDPVFLARLSSHVEDLDTRAVVDRMRQDVISLFAELGAIHFQVGKTYPLRETRAASGQEILMRLKAALDPESRMNPGALGLGEQ